MTSSLKIDNKTLEDLNILPGTLPYSLLNLLDSRAKTNDGRETIKRTILSPSKNVTEIHNRQAEIAFAIENFDILSPIQIDDRIIYSCRDYMNSNIVGISTPSRISAFTHSWGYRKFLPTLTSGVHSMLTLLSESQRLLSVSKCSPPHGIGGILKTISSYIREVDECSVGRPKSLDCLSDLDVLILDHIFRIQLHDKFVNLLCALAELDCLIALAKFNIDFQLVFPEVTEGDSTYPNIKLSELRHIVIDGCIPNSIRLSELQNIIFLTGPNMSGKSSFLKALGWAVFLAHLGMGVPAESMSLTVFDEIISDIDNTDNTAEGQSYFLSEVRRVKSIAEKVVSDRRVLVICDELFKGTNVIDASDCTHVVVEGFSKRKNSIFLIASHIHDVKMKVANAMTIGWFHFESSINNNAPVYSFRLKEGISDQRHGLLILRNEGVYDLLFKHQREKNEERRAKTK